MKARSLCIIGNSAIACVRKASDQNSGLFSDRIILTYFASSAYSAASLNLDGRHLVSSDSKVREQFSLSSNGRDRIDIDAYDAFLIYGLTFEFRDYMRAFQHHALFDDQNVASGRSLMSRHVHEQVVANLSVMRPGARLVSQIRSVSSSPIIIAAAPCPTPSAIRQRGFSAFDLERDKEFLGVLLARYEDEFRKVSKSLGVTGVLQGRETMSQSGFTSQKYTEGGVGLPQNVSLALGRGQFFRESAVDDPWHLNEEFGKIVLKQIVALADRGWAAPNLLEELEETSDPGQKVSHRPAIHADGRLLPGTVAQIRSIMERRKIGPSEIGRELGLTSVPSLALALNKGTRIKNSEILLGLAAWLDKNAD